MAPTGPYLCPNSFNVVNLDNNLREMRTWGIKAGFNRHEITFGIYANLPNHFPANQGPYQVNWQITNTDAFWGGVVREGNKYRVSNDALKILLARAIDYGALEADEALIPVNPASYRNQLIAHANAYLERFLPPGFLVAIQLNNTNGTKTAQQVSELIEYWTSDTCR